jgi:hypothetical protein
MMYVLFLQHVSWYSPPWKIVTIWLMHGGDQERGIQIGSLAQDLGTVCLIMHSPCMFQGYVLPCSHLAAGAIAISIIAVVVMSLGTKALRAKDEGRRYKSDQERGIQIGSLAEARGERTWQTWRESTREAAIQCDAGYEAKQV